MPVVSVPAPTGGINLSQNVANLALNEARDACNLWGSGGIVSKRKGTVSLGVTHAQEPLQLFSYVANTGVRYLFALGSTGVLVRYDSLETTPSLATVATIGIDDYWNATNFRNRLYLFNGVNTGQVVTASSITAVGFTFSGLASSDFTHAGSYKNRMYLVRKNSCEIYYAGVDAVTGALTLYDIESLFNNGGKILWCGSWSRDSGAGSQDLFIVISTEGEVLAFQGSFPGGSDWALQGRYYISEPVSIRAIAPFGSDLIVVTVDGVIALSQVIQTRGGSTSSTQLYGFADRISPIIKYYSSITKSSHGWQVVHWLRENMLIVNVPISESEFIQLVYNSETNAWFKFKGINAQSIAKVGSIMYSAHKDTFVVLKYFSGFEDFSDTPIEVEYRGAFSDYGLGGGSKRSTMILPYFATNADLEVEIGVDTNFAETVYAGEAQVSDEDGSAWNVAIWNISPWAGAKTLKDYWIPVEGFGKVLAIKYKFTTKAEVDFSGAQMQIDVGQSL